ncbi:fatty acid alpha-hydroxylase [Phlyctochytrium bullatum]|nr:fatty acid alpha-hydroxylase [Phlyctochytrium bullatum]
MARQTVYSAEEVASHRTARSTWIIVNNKVYDVTEFVNDHPGGADLVLQYAGQDATKIMKDHVSHEHSDAAYSMLDDFYIGDLELTAAKTSTTKKVAEASVPKSTTKAAAPVAYGAGQKKAFIDVTKPMLSQVFFGNFSKDFYMEQVHIPRTCKGSAPIFGSPTLEIFTKTPWWVIPAVYIPISSACVYYALKSGLGFDATACWFGLGLLTWTLIEYTLHRWLFHVDELLPDNSVCITLHFLLHGIHHFLPMDRMRLVMPPALGLTLSFPFYVSFTSMLPTECGHALVGGAYFGFMAYDLVHYYLHHGRPLTAHLREMKSYHLDHHYKNAHLGYGITSKLWDYVFNTVLL